MNSRIKTSLAVILVLTLLLLAGTARAHNPGYTIPGPGRPAAAPTLNGAISPATEWSAHTPYAFPVAYIGNPLKADVKVLHKSDGIYFLAEVSDSSNNNNDTFSILLDINHDGVAGDATDFGVEFRRGGTAAWGSLAVSPATWPAVPAANFGISATPSNPWVVEFRLPAGPPSNLVVGTTVGIYFVVYDVDKAFDPNSAKYTQWPEPPAASPEDFLAGTPNQWGNYVFDPTTTFPNLSVTDIRRGNAGAGDYYKISHTGSNVFEARVNNPGGTAVPNATNARLNLYLAARGINEPWHRLDAASTIDGDCAAAGPWPSLVLPTKTDVCTGANVAHPDIGTLTQAQVITNTALYTIKTGANRLDGGAVTINGGTNNYFNVIDWDTTAQQDPLFTDFTFNGTLYPRSHSCMMAELLWPNDPNVADNLMQVNMDFICVVGGGVSGYNFSLGYAGFLDYDPGPGKDMFLQVSLQNMDPQLGWHYQLEGVKALGQPDTYVAHIQGRQPLGVKLLLNTPPAAVFGRPLKENLMVPAKAGGYQANAFLPSGEPPVYVKVTPGTTLRISNYSIMDDDEQFVDLDGRGPLLPPNGAAGLPASALQKAIQKVGDKYKLLLAPGSPLGSLVGSWDNFRTSFPIREGVQVRVPAGAGFLALGINDAIGLYGDNSGTGFRLKIAERPAGSADAGTAEVVNASFAAGAAPPPQPAQPDIVPISDWAPTLCINGYENIRKQREINGTPHNLYRYVGNVCWGVVNIHAQDHPKPDEGDKFDGPGVVPPRRGGCGSNKKTNNGNGNGNSNVVIGSVFTLAGVVLVGRRARRRRSRVGRKAGR